MLDNRVVRVKIIALYITLFFLPGNILDILISATTLSKRIFAPDGAKLMVMETLYPIIVIIRISDEPLSRYPFKLVAGRRIESHTDNESNHRSRRMHHPAGNSQLMMPHPYFDRGVHGNIIT